ncbi:MAG: hypothetical protein RL197_1269 [Actinomycetota bacterium]|jgi:hypothetical protein
MKKLVSLATTALSLSLLLSGCTKPTETESLAAGWISGPCSEEKPGVTLATDYQGEVSVRCALDFKGSGWELFEAVGMKVRGTAKYPDAFACQIDELPANAPCDDSAGAYWGYYLGADEVWGYASTGASDQFSNCGTWEGWVYMETEKTVSNLPKPTSFNCK